MDAWGERVGDARLPHWLRIACLAYSSHGENGHATFKRGEISLALATVNKDTGEITPYANIHRAIQVAVEYGWLEEGSFWGCLIVPAHAIRKGDLSHSPTPCPIHIKRNQCKGGSVSERFTILTSTPSERYAR